VLDSKKTAKECLEKAYQKVKQDTSVNIPSDEIKGNWGKLIEILEDTKKLSDTPEHILSKTVKFFPDSKKFDDFCKMYRIKLDIRGILLANNEALTTKSKLEYGDIYNEEITKILPTDEDIKNEIEARKEQSRKLLEEKKDACFDIPRYDGIFEKDEDTIFFLERLGFLGELPLDIYNQQNRIRYIKISRSLSSDSSNLKHIALELYKKTDKYNRNIITSVKQLQLFILSIATYYCDNYKSVYEWYWKRLFKHAKESKKNNSY